MRIGLPGYAWANAAPATTNNRPAKNVFMVFTSVDFRLCDRGGAFKEVEIAAFVGLSYVAREDRAIAALEFALRLLPGRFSFFQLFFRDFQIQLPLLDIELDEIAIAYQREWAADEGFRRDVQHAGAVARAAHARIRDAHHVAHALLEELLRHRQHAPLGHPGAAERAGVAQHENAGGVDLEIVAVDARGHVAVVLEDHGLAHMLEKLRGSSCRLNDRTVRCERASHDDEAAGCLERVRAGANHFGVINLRPMQVLAQVLAVDG